MLDVKNKVVLKNTIGAFVVKGGALVVSLFTMPAYIKYFNNQAVLGVWFTMLSVLSWMLSFDLGIGNGLRNKLVVAISQNDRLSMKKYISSGLVAISGLVGILSIIGFVAIPFIPWQAVFNISGGISQKTLAISMVICFGGIMLQFIFNIVNSINYAMQLSAVNNFLALITSVLQLIFILVFNSGDAEKNLVYLSVAHVTCIILPLLIAGIIVFATKLRDCLPNIKYFSKEMAKQVVGLGGMFFYCQILSMLMVAINEFLITSLYLPENVVEYQIYYKIFSLPPMLVALATTPLWSMVTRALAENDFIWLKKLFRRLECLIGIVALCEFILIFCSQFIINIWLRDEAITVNMAYASIFAFYGFAFAYSNIVTTIVNGVGHLKTQAIIMTALVALKFILIFLLKDVYGWILIVLAVAILVLIYSLFINIRVEKYIKFKINDAENTYKI
mgnify:CR=1 FL=1